MQAIEDGSMISKFRTEYIVKCTIQILGGLSIAGFCMFKWLTARDITVSNSFFWILCVTLFGLIIYLPLTWIPELNRITVLDNEIVQTNLVTWASKRVDYGDIKSFSTTRVTSWVGPGRSEGYFLLEIKLVTGKSLFISEDLYQNYNELKARIYDRTKF